MQLSSLDVAVVMAYIILIFSIAVGANVFMKKHLAANKGLRPIENHYLAGRSITFWEAVLSIIATEFSAMAFLTCYLVIGCSRAGMPSPSQLWRRASKPRPS